MANLCTGMKNGKNRKNRDHWKHLKKLKSDNFNTTKALLVPMIWVILSMMAPATASAQRQAYFVDGFHGGIWGHFPYTYSSFIAAEMKKHPDWKVNLEIEPVTWDSIQGLDPEGYRYIQQQLADTAVTAAMEYVNPAYGQPYMFNISGESIIRQFEYGMQSLRIHFPNIRFRTYSSEEPCFSSALPGILKAFGFRYASLKNPNTCWGGYTAAHGGALLNWVGPDGSAILTVPRYSTEKLEPGSTWQTNAWRNSPDYIQDAWDGGIMHPVGMTLQDAGWRHGPWLGSADVKTETTPNLRRTGKGKAMGKDPAALAAGNSIYTTWRNYFNLMTTDNKNHPAQLENWHLSQEDIHVSLVWGGQILQRVAQAVRQTENSLIQTETLAALNHRFDGTPWPGASLDKAWKNLLLSQHHDTWIVPYNKKHGITWQQQVNRWTDTALGICDSIENIAAPNQTDRRNKQGTKNYPESYGKNKGIKYLRVYNGTGRPRKTLVEYTYKARGQAAQNNSWLDASPILLDPGGRQVDYQVVITTTKPTKKSPSVPADLQFSKTLYFEASVPALGYATYQLLKPEARPETLKALRKKRGSRRGPRLKKSAEKNIITQLKDGTFQLETDLYRMQVDPEKGGVITSLLLKENTDRIINRNGGPLNTKDNTHEFVKTPKAGPDSRPGLGLAAESIPESNPDSGLSQARGINELRGYFYNEQVFHSSCAHPATVTVIANGPLYAALRIQGQIGSQPFTQTIRVSKMDPLIRTALTIDWRQNHSSPLGIGHYSQKKGFRSEDPHKAFYDSRYKLLTLFPVDITGGALYKDAPFDIYQSKLKNTFYDSWDSIKNDVLLHWVDIQDQDKDYGFALFSDATTSYAHGDHLPLGLTTQYIGKGLFGADYTVDGSTTLKYAFMPHARDWSTQVTNAAEDYNKPLIVKALDGGINNAMNNAMDEGSGVAKEIGMDAGLNETLKATAVWPSSRSFLTLDAAAGWQVSAFKLVQSEAADQAPDKTGSYMLRLFNATGDDQPHWIRLEEPWAKDSKAYANHQHKQSDKTRDKTSDKIKDKARNKTKNNAKNKASDSNITSSIPGARPGIRQPFVERVDLNGKSIERIPVQLDGNGCQRFQLSIPPLGFCTLTITYSNK